MLLLLSSILALVCGMEPFKISDGFSEGNVSLMEEESVNEPWEFETYPGLVAPFGMNSVSRQPLAPFIQFQFGNPGDSAIIYNPKRRFVRGARKAGRPEAWGFHGPGRATKQQAGPGRRQLWSSEAKGGCGRR